LSLNIFNPLTIFSPIESMLFNIIS
jgi:hypothetical protein